MSNFYTLLDSGHGKKLEQYGPIRVVRPEPQALWTPSLPEADWANVHAVFKPAKEEGSDNGNWQALKDVPARWQMDWHNLPFWARLTPFRHLGCFPDQVMQWQWVKDASGQGQKMLNLFGYTGVMSLIAAQQGSAVTHVDASKKAILFGKENADLAGLANAPLRWMVDDALAFAQREVRRGNTYHTIVLDPPKFGRGPDGEKWDFMENFSALAQTLPALLAPQSGAQVIVTAYALRVSSSALASALAEVMGPCGQTTHGAITQTDAAGRSFDSAYWARFIRT